MKEITNLESMQNGFQQPRKKIIGEKDIDPSRVETLKQCDTITLTTSQ